jgi:hypothetical protein
MLLIPPHREPPQFNMKLLKQLVIPLAALALLAIGPAARAAAIAGAEIELDGKVIAGYSITHDNESREQLYDMLATHSLTFERDFKVPVDGKEPAEATLKGSIRIYTRVAKHRDIKATTTELKLVQVEGRNWRVDQESLARALKAQPAKADAGLSFTAWDESWKVRSTYLLREEGRKRLNELLGRKPDHIVKGAVSLLPSATLEIEGRKYAIEADSVLLLMKNETRTWNEKGIRDELIRLSDLQPEAKLEKEPE